MKIDLNLGDTKTIMSECKRNGLTRPQTAYVLATARWETAHTMKPVEEAFWLSDGWRARNLRYYPWHGRGYVQLTWQANYIRAGKELDVDLITDPDRVMDPNIAAKILVAGSMAGWFTGKGLGDYINKSKTDYVSARRVINGTDKAGAIADLARDYERAIAEAPQTPPQATTGGLAAMWGHASIAALLAALLGKARK